MQIGLRWRTICTRTHEDDLLLDAFARPKAIEGRRDIRSSSRQSWMVQYMTTILPMFPVISLWFLRVHPA